MSDLGFILVVAGVAIIAICLSRMRHAVKDFQNEVISVRAHMRVIEIRQQQTHKELEDVKSKQYPFVRENRNRS